MLHFRSLGLSLLVFCGLAVAAWASPQIAQIVYREGRPVVFRDGRLVWDPVEFGFPLEDFDFIRNDRESLVEIRTEPRIGVVLVAGPRTTFSLGVSALDHERLRILELMTGAVSITVDPASEASDLAGEPRFTVRTERVVIDSGPGSFDVALSPTGDVRVSTRDGVAACRLDDDRVLFSRPGIVVEFSADGGFRTVPVPTGELEEFRIRRTRDHAAASRADLERVFRGYEDRYVRLRDRFDDRYAALFSRRDIIDTWMRESGQGRIGAAPDLDREIREIGAYLDDIRPSLAVFEKVYYRILELKAFAADECADARDAACRSTGDFFVDADRRVLEQRMSTVRYVLKMFAQRNDNRGVH